MTRQRVTIPRTINRWTALKLEHLDAYLQGYAVATKMSEECYYIDGFAGCGDCILQENNLPVPGSAWRALNTVPSFSAYFFVEQHVPSADHLKSRISETGTKNAYVFNGDTNQVLPERVLPLISHRAPSFAFLDPTGLQLHWETITALAGHRRESRYKMELLMLYPYDMSINRNLFNPSVYSSLDDFYGGRQIWQDQLEMSQSIQEDADARRERFVSLYVHRLRGLGYAHVHSFGPLYEGAIPKYHVVFAGDNDTGLKIIDSVWAKFRYIPGELGYSPLRRPNVRGSPRRLVTLSNLD